MKITAKQYAHAWHEQLQATTSADWDAISQAVLETIHQHGDLKLLPEVVRLVEALHYKQNDITPITVTSAQTLSPAMLEQAVETALPVSRVAIQTAINPHLIGGVRLETLNQRWDISLRKQLNALANSLTH